MRRIVFNVPTLVGQEMDYLRESLALMWISGNGAFTRRCQAHLEATLGSGKVLLTHSCTAALEMAALLADIGPGDEIIMPSFTFSSTANAFVLRGAVPVFVDIRPDTLNLDESLIEAAITARTKAICVVHYAGVGCEMDTIIGIASRRGVMVIEDAAQALHSTYRDRPLGTFGAFSAFSFHETKNVIAGEGGALVVNDPTYVARSEIIWEKGTNRAQFQRGEVAKYTWVDVGSSFLPSDMIAAFLLAQLERGTEITRERLDRWNRYYDAMEALESDGLLRRPIVPENCRHNGHIFYVLAPDAGTRDFVLEQLKQEGIQAIMHYVPLHSAPAGRKFGRASGGRLHVTDDVAARLIRLPLHPKLDEATQNYIISRVREALVKGHSARIPIRDGLLLKDRL